MKRMQEAVSAPSDLAADFDEDDLEAELEELEGAELEEQLLLPVAAVSAAPVHDIAGLLPAPPVPQGTDKESELADLQAEMAFWAGLAAHSYLRLCKDLSNPYCGTFPLVRTYIDISYGSILKRHVGEGWA